MAILLDQIEWGEPFLPVIPDPQWESEIKRMIGVVPESARRLAANTWLRKVFLHWTMYRPLTLSPRLSQIVFLVTSQENSCRYCYGSARAQMRMLGYGEKLIDQIERDVQLAELDEKERALIRFCRTLARSKPRPGRADREALIAAGYSPLAVAEIALLIALHCFGNRVATLIACPPSLGMERLAGTFLGRLMGIFMEYKMRRGTGFKIEAPPGDARPLQPILDALEGLPMAKSVGASLSLAFNSPVLPRNIKYLMFAVVARSVECRACERGMADLLTCNDFPEAEIQACLTSFSSPQLDARDRALLAWARDTVHLDPATMQKRTRQLAERIGPAETLEAIGVAALANAMVRLAMLLV